MGQELFDFRRPHLGGVAEVVEANEAAIPVYISGFGARGVGPAADGGADVVFEFHVDSWGVYHIIIRVYLITSYCAPSPTSGKTERRWHEPGLRRRERAKYPAHEANRAPPQTRRRRSAKARVGQSFDVDPPVCLCAAVIAPHPR